VRERPRQRRTIAAEEPLGADEPEAVVEPAPLELGEAQLRAVAAAAGRVHQLDQSPCGSSQAPRTVSSHGGITTEKEVGDQRSAPPMSRATSGAAAGWRGRKMGGLRPSRSPRISAPERSMTRSRSIVPRSGPDRSVEGREPAGIRRLALLFDSGKACSPLLPRPRGVAWRGVAHGSRTRLAGWQAGR
jgi:hypothetical protein